MIHVVESLDTDNAAANGPGSPTDGRRSWQVAAGGRAVGPAPGARGTEISDVAGAVLDQVGVVAPDLLVIGARRRSPVGKAFLGSVAQTLILQSDVPVLVVKSGP